MSFNSPLGTNINNVSPIKLKKDIDINYYYRSKRPSNKKDTTILSPTQLKIKLNAIDRISRNYNIKNLDNIIQDCKSQSPRLNTINFNTNNTIQDIKNEG